MLKRWYLVIVLLRASVALTAMEAGSVVGAQLQAEESSNSKECVGANGVDGEAAELSVESGLNATGHWLAKVRLQHAVSVSIQEPGERSPVQLLLRRSTRRAPRGDNMRLVTLQATLTGPSTLDEEDQPWEDSKKSHSKSKNSLPKPIPPVCPLPQPCPKCLKDLTSSPPQGNHSSSCPTCPSTPTRTSPQPCLSSCPTPPACPTCPTAPPPPPPPKCPSPCPSPCPKPAPCPPLPLVAPKCPSPCPAAVACPSCPAPPSCPSPCAKPPPCPACPSCSKPLPYGYKRVSGSSSAYRLHLIPRDWFAAQATCEREGGYLAIINTQAEANAISSLLSDPAFKYVEYVAIGIHDLHKEGTWYTVLDEPFNRIQYQKWGRGEPNNDGNQDCGGLYPGSMTLDDDGCSNQRVFLCEQS